MKIEACWWEPEYEWSIFIFDDNGYLICNSDNDIANFIKIDLTEYQLILMKNFNSVFSYAYEKTECHFKTKKDADEAIEWIESIIVMNLLTQ